MKKMKLILPFMAMTFAMVFAFAGNNKDVATGEYIQQNSPQSCTEVTANCGAGEELCQLSSMQVYGERNGTICGAPLRRNSL